jgi:hypothetical protein
MRLHQFGGASMSLLELVYEDGPWDYGWLRAAMLSNLAAEL